MMVRPPLISRSTSDTPGTEPEPMPSIRRLSEFGSPRMATEMRFGGPLTCEVVLLEPPGPVGPAQAPPKTDATTATASQRVPIFMLPPSVAAYSPDCREFYTGRTLVVVSVRTMNESGLDIRLSGDSHVSE